MAEHTIFPCKNARKHLKQGIDAELNRTRRNEVKFELRKEKRDQLFARERFKNGLANSSGNNVDADMSTSCNSVTNKTSSAGETLWESAIMTMIDDDSMSTPNNNNPNNNNNNSSSNSNSNNSHTNNNNINHFGSPTAATLPDCQAQADNCTKPDQFGKLVSALFSLGEQLSSSQISIDQVIQSGVLQRLIYYLEYYTKVISFPKIQQLILWCFGTMASGDSTQTAAIVEPHSNVVLRLAIHLLHSNTLLVQHYSLRFLANVALDCVQFRDLLLQYGVVYRLLSLLHPSPGSSAEDNSNSSGVDNKDDFSDVSDVSLKRKTRHTSSTHSKQKPNDDSSTSNLLPQVARVLDCLCHFSFSVKQYRDILPLGAASIDMLDHEHKYQSHVIVHGIRILSRLTGPVAKQTENNQEQYLHLLNTLVDLGLFPRLLNLLQDAQRCDEKNQQEMYLYRNILDVLGYFAEYTEKDYTESLMKLGLGKQLVHCATMDDYEIRGRVWWILSNVVCDASPAVISSLLDDEPLVQVMLQAGARQEHTIQKYVASIVCNMMLLGSYDQVIRFALRRGVAFICRHPLQFVYEPTYIVLGLRALLRLLKSTQTQSSSELHRRIKVLIEETDGIRTIETLQEHENERVYQKVWEVMNFWELESEDDNNNNNGNDGDYNNDCNIQEDEAKCCDGQPQDYPQQYHNNTSSIVVTKQETRQHEFFQYSFGDRSSNIQTPIRMFPQECSMNDD